MRSEKKLRIETNASANAIYGVISAIREQDAAQSKTSQKGATHHAAHGSTGSIQTYPSRERLSDGVKKHEAVGLEVALVNLEKLHVVPWAHCLKHSHLTSKKRFTLSLEKAV